MFTIKSYIQIPHKIIDDLKKVQQNPSAYFIDINNEKKIIKIKNQFDLDYLEGTIYIAFNDQIIMDYEMWDLVDTLWAYFLILIKDVIEKDKAEIYFPDQAIQIKMQANKDFIMFSLIMPNNETRQWNLPRDLFLKALLDGAQYFFEKMVLIFEENQEDYVNELKKIQKLKKKLWN
ncbi:MAG TPA: hypothetical protein VKR54_04110 [Candidatus Babeliales bacterium]|jgi:hypothetical protein|nr:hypothetical protein [Candidatus Babeliales bacterium]